MTTDFEAAVLAWIAARTADEALRAQLNTARVVEREWTRVGCYSKLATSSDAPPSIAPHSTRGPVSGPYFDSEIELNHGGTLIWMHEGRAARLEIYANGDSFPEDHAALGKFELFEIGAPRR